MTSLVCSTICCILSIIETNSNVHLPLCPVFFVFNTTTCLVFSSSSGHQPKLSCSFAECHSALQGTVWPLGSGQPEAVHPGPVLPADGGWQQPSPGVQPQGPVPHHGAPGPATRCPEEGGHHLWHGESKSLLFEQYHVFFLLFSSLFYKVSWTRTFFF